MAIGQGYGAARHVQTLFTVGAIGDLSDRQLLDRFARRDGDRAEIAFAALVERHGPMVLRTCRAVLRDGHDAHDAFQATFLVLARRAGSLWVGESVAAWLHQVARRTALCSRSASARRRKHETRAASSAPVLAHDPVPDDLGEILDAEIARLPDRFRAAVVLCLLEGQTHDQAARHLNLPVGTLQSRLARGRERLRSNLTRRGLAPGVAPTGAIVPASLLDLTSRAATRFAAGKLAAGMVPASILSLAKEVGSVLIFSKWKLIGTAMLSVGFGLFSLNVLASLNEPQDKPQPNASVARGSTPEPGLPSLASPSDTQTLRIPLTGDTIPLQINRSIPDREGKNRVAETLEVRVVDGRFLVRRSRLRSKDGKIETTVYKEVTCDSVEIIKAIDP